MRKRNGTLLFSSALISLFMFAGLSFIESLPVSAQEGARAEQDERDRNRLIGIETGNLQFDPYLRQEVRYDSNIFREESGEEDDVISDTTPGFSLDYNREDVRLNGSFSSVLHRNFDVKDADDDVDINGSVGGRVNLGDRFFTSASSSYNETNSPLEHPFRDILTAVNRKTTGTVGFEEGKYHGEVTYTYHDYEVDEVYDGLDYDQWTGSSLFSYQYVESIQFRVRGVYGRQRYDDGPDDLITEYTGGVLWTPQESFGMVVDAGYREDRFDNDGGDYKDPVLRVTGSWLPTETTTVNLQLSHESADSVQTNYITQDQVGASTVWEPEGDWSYSTNLSYTRKEEAEEDVPQDQKDLINGGVSTTWSGLNDFTDITLGYEYREKLTDDGVSEYDAHIVMLSGIARF